MKKLYMLLIISLSGVFILNSCKPDKNEPGSFPIPERLLSYFYFKKYSFWVFESSKTNKQDTFSVRQNEKISFYSTNNDYLESAKVQIHRSNDDFFYEYKVSTLGSSRCIKENGTTHPCYSLFCEKYKSGNYVGEATYFSFPFYEGLWGYSGSVNPNSKFTINHLFDSLEVKGTYYYNIAEIKINNCITNNNSDVVFFWAEETGIIKWIDQTNSETWELIQSSIIK